MLDLARQNGWEDDNDWPLVPYLWTTDLDLDIPNKALPKGKWEYWITEETNNSVRQRLSKIQCSDGRGLQVEILFDVDSGQPSSRTERYFRDENSYVVHYGDDGYLLYLYEKGKLIMEEDVDDYLHVKVHYDYTDGRLVGIREIDNDGEQKETIYYDTNGRIKTVVSIVESDREVMRRSLVYDDRGRLLKIIRSQNRTVNRWDIWEYSDDDREVKETYIARKRLNDEYLNSTENLKIYDEKSRLILEEELTFEGLNRDKVIQKVVTEFDTKRPIKRTVKESGSDQLITIQEKRSVELDEEIDLVRKYSL